MCPAPIQDADQRLVLSLDPSFPPARVGVFGTSGFSVDATGALRVSLGGIPFVFFSGENPTNPTGAAGDWARLNDLMQSVAYKAAIILEPGFIRADTEELIPSGTTIVGNSGVTIVQQLNPAGTFLTAAFAATVGAVTSPITTLAIAASRGDKAITLTAAKPAGSIILVESVLNGNRCSVHTIQSIVGNVATLDRPLPRDYEILSTVQVVASVPKDIRIYGNGMTMTGIGKRYIELAFAQHCRIDDINFNNSQGMVNDLLVSFDVGGNRNEASNLTANCGPGVTALACFALESNDASRLDKCRANCNGSANHGFVLYDCADCDVLSSAAYDATAGSCYLLTTDNGVLDASTRGCISVRVTDCTGLRGNSGYRVDGGSIDCDCVNSSFEKCSVGVQVGDGLSTVRNAKFANVNARFNTSIGFDISSATPGTQITNLDITGNGTSSATGSGVVASDYFTLEGLRADSGNNVNLILATAGAHLDGLDCAANPTPAINGWIQLNGGTAIRYTIGGGHNKLSMNGAANSNAISTGAVLNIENTRITVAGGASTAVFTNANGTLRIGRDNDWSGAANAYAQNGGGQFSQGTLTIGAAPVAVSFLDLKATDRVRMTLQTLAGAALSAPPVIAYTPGTGFTAARVTAGDTSVWEWSVTS